LPQVSTYLDHNATAPLRPVAREAMVAAMDALSSGGNPSSVHRAGRVARRLVEDARREVAALAGVVPDEVVFTSGGTEANSLAIDGTLHSGAAERLIVSATEHASVLETAAASGVDVVTLPVDGSGLVDLDALAAVLAEDSRPALVCIMSANNETGVIQPLDEIIALVKHHEGRVHVDAVQTAGRLPLGPLLDAHTLALSAHKLGGPQGAGALIVRGKGKGKVDPVLRGGGQELRRRAGTENVVGIAGFGAAAGEAAQSEKDAQLLSSLRDRVEALALASAAATGHSAQVSGAGVARLPNTSCVAFDGVKAETLLMALDLAGICVSSGSACSSGKVARSHVLDAMGLPESQSAGAIRVSLGWNSSEADVERFGTALEQALKNIRPAGTVAAADSNQDSGADAVRSAGE